mmetsp:Transcript_40159/g.86927  ORF Transcript_40159/g.86927 Transcript_40159/m.86927 type:complete len:244 (-) Transcript_40159:180-911(-)
MCGFGCLATNHLPRHRRPSRATLGHTVPIVDPEDIARQDVLVADRVPHQLHRLALELAERGGAWLFRVLLPGEGQELVVLVYESLEPRVVLLLNQPLAQHVLQHLEEVVAQPDLGLQAVVAVERLLVRVGSGDGRGLAHRVHEILDRLGGGRGLGGLGVLRQREDVERLARLFSEHEIDDGDGVRGEEVGREIHNELTIVDHEDRVVKGVVLLAQHRLRRHATLNLDLGEGRVRLSTSKATLL